MPNPDAFSNDCPSQGILALIGSKWSMLILCALRNGPARTGELRRQLRGVSAKMLTQTLRQLERHGIVERHDFGELPPRVEYQLSKLGRSLSALVIEVERWVVTHYESLTASARRYDSESA